MAGLSPTDDVRNSQAYAALAQYLSGQATVADTQDLFCGPVKDAYNASGGSADVEDLLNQSWRAVITLAASSPHGNPAHRKLEDFLLSLQGRRDVEIENEQCVVQGMTVWRDLPFFGWQLREAWNSSEYGFITPS
jgi:hypothetical protein